MKHIGDISIDSGTLLITDPCYKKYNPKCPDDFFNKNTNVMSNGSALIVGFMDDGVYPVFVKKDKDGRPSKIIISLDENPY